jgi:hypothetical protein
MVMVYGAGVLLLVTNAQLERLPLQELLALLFLDCLVRNRRTDARHVLALCAVGVGLIAGPASADPMSLVNGLRLKLRTPGEWAYGSPAGNSKVRCCSTTIWITRAAIELSADFCRSI